MTDEPTVLWGPDLSRETGMSRFRDWVRAEQGVDLADYDALWQWSVSDLPAFWRSVAGFCGVRFHSAWDAVLGSMDMPGATWFPGATLNYAEQALTGHPDDAEAVVFQREDGRTERLTFSELRS